MSIIMSENFLKSLLRKPWRNMEIFKKSRKYIGISNSAIRSHGLVIHSHGLLIRSLELDNPFHRIAICSLEFDLSNLRERFNNPWERILNARERIAQFNITIYFCYFGELNEVQSPYVVGLNKRNDFCEN